MTRLLPVCALVLSGACSGDEPDRRSERTDDPSTTTPTTTEPTPVERLEGCDPDWCVLTPEGGPSGGDLCRCTIPAANHPAVDSVEGSCFSAGGGAPSVDLSLVIDVQADGWSGVSVDTCNATPGDAVLALFEGSPSEDTEIACARATGDAGCSRITRTGAPAEALTLVIDERIPGTWWDGQTDRVIDLELFPVACGNGYLEDGEECDDGNLSPGDGCDAACVEEEPLREIVGCDPAWCSLFPAGGPNGGDLCRCVIHPNLHPVFSSPEGSCFEGFIGAGLEFEFDLAGLGYAGYAVDTCQAAPADSSIAVFDGDPLVDGVEAACNEDGGPNFCAQVGPNGGGPAAPLEAPESGRVHIVVNEFGSQDFWDRTNPRTIDVELFVEGTCGDGVVDFQETCDDGNLVDQDGCDATCQRETATVFGCDPTYCTLDPGLGPNGGDLCSCRFGSLDHPTVDRIEASCFGGSPANEHVIFIDLAAEGYAGWAVDTCAVTPQDSALAAYDSDPLAGGAEVACNEDAGPDYCAQLGANGGGTPIPQLAPGSGELWVVVDEWDPGLWWDGITVRQVDLELFPAGVCGDGVVDFGEACDDGNLLGGDGCDGSCQPETVVGLVGCDPAFCTLTPAGGASGGDLCQCTFDPAFHPTVDSVEGSCFGGLAAPELVVRLDLAADGYVGYAVDTCAVTAGDSSVAVWDADPVNGGVELACDEDSGPDYCAQVGPNAGGAPMPLPAPATGEIWVVIDQWEPGLWWDGTTARVIDLELFGLASCGDGVLGPLETCDDGNLVSGDGCSDQCTVEAPTLLSGCDPSWCTFTAAAGPNGGDVCSCTLDPAAHPTTDAVEGTCFSNYGGSAANELTWHFDLTALGYSQIAVDTCQVTPGDSAIGIWDADPQGGGLEVACDQDSGTDFCAQLGANGGAAALPLAAPATGQAWVVVDEWTPGSWWDGVNPRTVEFELLP